MHLETFSDQLKISVKAEKFNDGDIIGKLMRLGLSIPAGALGIHISRCFLVQHRRVAKSGIE